MTRCSLLAAGLLIVAVSGNAATTVTAGERCESALAQSQHLMAEEPVLKEELATGVMWMRLEAESRLIAGQDEACADIAENVLSLLRSYREGQTGNREIQAEW